MTMSDPKRSQLLRLNPREIEDAVREERRKWRIFRLQQVREQAGREAERVREVARERQAQEVQGLEQKAFKKWQDEKENKVQQLQDEYDSCFQAFGKAHNDAKEQPDAAKVLSQNMKFNQHKAAKRGREARKAYVEEQSQQNSGKVLQLQRQQCVLRKEKQRANRVAHLPTPEAFKKKKIIKPKPAPSVQLYEHGTLTTTSYVPKNIIVEKEIMSTKPRAHQLAEAEEMAQASSKEAEKIEAEGFERKREERGRAALHRERLHRDFKHRIDQLDHALISHDLTAFMQGADASMHETAESRLQKQALNERNMEKAAERILKRKVSFGSIDDTPTKENSGQDSDLKEISLDSKVVSPEVLSAKEKEFIDLRDSLKKTRSFVMQGNDDSFNSSAKRDVISTSVREISSRPDIRGSEISRQTKPVHDQNHLVDQQPEYSGSQGESSALGKPESSLNAHVNDNSAPEPRQFGLNSDIHFAETVPVHLISMYKGSDELPQNQISEMGEHRELPAHDSILGQSSSEGTILPASSDDIEVRIHLSCDSCASTDENSIPEDNFIRPVQSDRLPKQYRLETMSSTGESTEYLSLPSSLPHANHPLSYIDNLKKIQEQRQNIQRLLDSRGHGRNLERTSPLTYMQEMNAEGNGKRPIRKREKFEQKKREIVHHYTRKLINLKKDEIMQISASTVESSGLNVSSLNALVNSINIDGVGSTISPISCSTDISSPFYPDIDEVPTKLSSSPVCNVDPDPLHYIPRTNTHYDPKAYCNTQREKDSTSSDYQELVNGVNHPNHDLNENYCTMEVPKMNYAELSSGVLSSHPDSQDVHVQNLGKSTPYEASNSINSDVSDVKSDNPDFSRELQILNQLQALQKLKEILLLKRNILKERDKNSSLPHNNGNALTDAEEPSKKPQTDKTSLVSSNQKELVFQQIDSDLADDSSCISRTLSSSENTSVNKEKVIAGVPQSELHPNSLWRNVSNDSAMNANEDQFITLKPETCDMSSFCLSKFSGSGKVLQDKSFTSTEFKHLLPETSCLSKGHTQTHSHVSGTTYNSMVLKKNLDVPVVSHGGAITQNNLGPHTVSHSLNNMNKVKQDAHSYKTKSMTSESYDPSLSVLKKPPSYEISARQALTSSRDVSSDVPADICSHHLSGSQQNGTDIAESNKPPVNPRSSQRSSSESVNSIPDMSEILQRFGLTWAKSMIRKMDKTEEHSSSGN